MATHEHEDEKHFRFGLATVALEIGIVFGSVAIITHLRWLVRLGCSPDSRHRVHRRGRIASAA
jgi:hypothetical protein